MNKLSASQVDALSALSEPGTFAAHGKTLWTGTHYRLNGEGRSFAARTLWSLIDRELLDYENVRCTFRINETGRRALEHARNVLV